MKLEFISDRNNDLYRVYEQVQTEHKYKLTVKEAAQMAINCEAESYYLTTKHIVGIIQIMRCNPEYKPKKYNKLRYNDIFSRYWKLKKEHPTFTITKIAKLIDAEKAPRFYLTPQSARKLLYILIKNRPRNAVPCCNHIHNSVSHE